MPVYLHALESAVPDTAYPQAYLRDVIRAQPELGRLGQRLVGSIFNASGIDQRHSVINALESGPDGQNGPFYDPDTNRLLRPSTRARNEVYIREASTLFVGAAEKVLAANPAIRKEDITHVVTVSCTGFFAPGPDFAVVRALGLPDHTQRFHVGFMGCYAAFPALRMARAFCEADPQAVVLVVAAELCSIHIKVADDPDTLIASSVFADGAGAALVSARTPAPHTPVLRVDAFETTLTPVGVGETDMAWKIGDVGFEMVLSTYVPAIIETHVEDALKPLLGPALHGEAPKSIERWAIHPGGRSILDKVQSSLSLSDEQLTPSREVLRQYGNMSSATVLFILKDLLHSAEDGERICSLAFGPGLTVESGLMTKLAGLD